MPNRGGRAPLGKRKLNLRGKSKERSRSRSLSPMTKLLRDMKKTKQQGSHLASCRAVFFVEE